MYFRNLKLFQIFHTNASFFPSTIKESTRISSGTLKTGLEDLYEVAQNTNHILFKQRCRFSASLPLFLQCKPLVLPFLYLLYHLCCKSKAFTRKTISERPEVKRSCVQITLSERLHFHYLPHPAQSAEQTAEHRRSLSSLLCLLHHGTAGLLQRRR